MRRLVAVFLGLVLIGLAPPARAQEPDILDAIARDYVRLQLEIGARDEGYIDAYYGPAAIREAATGQSAHPSPSSPPRPRRFSRAPVTCSLRRAGPARSAAHRASSPPSSPPRSPGCAWCAASG